jgi:hypothetical protein
MLADIKRGRINCVITKDLSRFGRNYVQSGYYIEEFFPMNNVRFIAIFDGTDTIKDEEDFSSFRNVMNEFYPREVSKKVKQVKRAGCEKGWFMGSQAPYGYRKSEIDKHILVVDENVSHIVKRIFREFSEGCSARFIGEKLNNEGILSPQAYFNEWNGKPLGKTDWGSATIMSMLERPVYIGHLEQCGRRKPSFKNPKRIVVPKNERVFVENTHEAIIDLDLWNDVQKLRKSKAFTRKPSGKSNIPIFTSQIKCADCGATMSAVTKQNNGKTVYRCGTYNNKGKSVCTAHSIREEVLEALVLSDIKAYASFDKNVLADKVLTILQRDCATSNSHIKQRLSKIKGEIAKIETGIANLYVDKAKIPDNIFYTTINKFNLQLEKLNSGKSSLNEQLDVAKTSDRDVSKWTELIEKYASFEKLTKEIAHALIDNITVSEFYKQDGKTTQDVVINYKFVGNLAKAQQEKLAV